MDSNPGDPISLPNSKSTGPEVFDTPQVHHNTHPRSVPRYVPQSTYGCSPKSRNLNARDKNGHYEISSTVPSRHHRQIDPDCSKKEPFPDGPTKVLPGKSNPDESIQETWIALVSLLECFGTESTSAVREPSLLGSSTTVKEHTLGNSTKPGHRRAGVAAQWKQGNGSPKGNNTGKGAPPDDDDDDDDVPWNGQGGGGANPLPSTTGRRIPYHEHFACPFHKSDSVRYAACHGANFKDIDSVLRVSLGYIYSDIHVPIAHLRWHEDLKLSSITFARRILRKAILHRICSQGSMPSAGVTQRRNGRRFTWPCLMLKKLKVYLPVGQGIPRYSSSDLVADWTPARHNCDIEQNINDSIKEAMSIPTTWEQCLHNWGLLIQRYCAEEYRQAEKRLYMMQDEGFQKLREEFAQKYPQESPNNLMPVNFALGFPYWQNPPMHVQQPNLPAVEFSNRAPTPGYGQTSNISSHVFPEYPFDGLGPFMAPDLPNWNYPSPGNLQDLAGYGSQYPELGTQGTGQPTHSFMLPIQWPTRGRRHTPDSGSFGSDFSSHQGGNYQY